jgi:iron complex outermembrane receptor protein
LNKRPVSVPANTASLWADYRLPQSLLAGLGVGAGVRYTGGSYADTANTVRTPSFVVADLGVHYDIASYRLALNVANLFDNDAVICTNGVASCDYIQGRTLTASLRYRW